MKGAIATGPAIVMRYSRFVHTLRSPPGNTIWSTGMGTVQLPSRGFAGFLGTGVPSGLVRVIDVRTGQERNRRDRADIEAANVVFAAHVEALERRSHQAAIPADERSAAR